jgi:N-methylhydantoinase B
MLTTTEVPARTIDPVTFEILSHRLYQVTKEMGITLERVGGTVNTTQLHDYMAALYRANGDIMSAGETIGWHVACASFAVKRIIARFQDDEGIAPGDVFLLNDPYVAAIHQSDVYVIAPIHAGDRLIAWSATFVHVMDIGAMSPGGNSPGATEICQEGIRIPGIKLVEGGKLRRDVFDAICNMTRQPAMVGLDLKCEIAANNVARRRIEEICAQYGADLVDEVSAAMIRYSAEVLKRRLREIPDGTWSATGTIQTTESWKATVSLQKQGDHLRFDFTGTDPQAKVGINLPYHASFGACYSSVMTALGFDIPKNHGAFAPIECIAPEGTIMNPRPPAPVSLNTTSGGAVAKYLTDTVISQMVATSSRWRGEVMAKNLGGRLARHAGVNQYGRYYVSTLLGISGSGATAHSDGINSGGGPITGHNVEWVELNFPLLHLFRRHIVDGAGAGKYRGGVGAEMALTPHDAPDHKIKGVALGVAGLRNAGQGMFGGYPSAPSLLTLIANTRLPDVLEQQAVPTDLSALGGDARLLPYCDFDLRESDVMVLTSGGGGGYGDPLERDPDLVASDVFDGLVSPDAARDVYGVITDGAGVDLTATETMRRQIRAQRTGANLKPSGGMKTTRNGRAAGASPAPREQAESGSDPIRENLELRRSRERAWLACIRCGYELSAAHDDWRDAAALSRLPATAAGPLMAVLSDHFALEQLCCPSCGALFESRIVETDSPPATA